MAFSDRNQRILAIACYSTLTIALSSSAYMFITGKELLTIFSILIPVFIFFIASSVLLLSNLPNEIKTEMKENKLQTLMSFLAVFKFPLLVTCCLILLIIGGGIIIFIVIHLLF